MAPVREPCEGSSHFIKNGCINAALLDGCISFVEASLFEYHGCLSSVANQIYEKVIVLRTRSTLSEVLSL